MSRAEKKSKKTFCFLINSNLGGVPLKVKTIHWQIQLVKANSVFIEDKIFSMSIIFVNFKVEDFCKQFNFNSNYVLILFALSYITTDM